MQSAPLGAYEIVASIQLTNIAMKEDQKVEGRARNSHDTRSSNCDAPEPLFDLDIVHIVNWI